MPNDGSELEPRGACDALQEEPRTLVQSNRISRIDSTPQQAANHFVNAVEVGADPLEEVQVRQPLRVCQ